MATDFTPGPWEVREGFIGPRLAPNSSIQVKVARIAGSYSDPEGNANARLIAAAPRMFNVLTLLLATEPEDMADVYAEARTVLDDICGEQVSA